VSALSGATGRALRGGPERHHEKAEEQGKLPVRERVARLLDPGTFAEEALLANWQEDGLGADGVVSGLGRIGGRPVALMANDPTVKAGSWGPKTVEKILRVQERALELRAPMVYLVDSAGARITEQVQMFPGRRGAGRIFHNQVKLSGLVPQVCVLFGPSAAGGAYIPAFCDIVIMREGNASMYLGSPRMAQMVIGEDVTLEEMGGARMHTGVSGCGHVLVTSDEEGIDAAVRYLSYLPGNCEQAPPSLGSGGQLPPVLGSGDRVSPAFDPAESVAGNPSPSSSSPPNAESAAGLAAPPLAPASRTPIGELIPADENKPFDMRLLLDALVDADSFMEIHARWAKELIVGFARLEGQPLGIVANQPKVKGGVLFVDSADKAARFIWTCNAFNVPLLFLADVPGFMIGTQVERQGIIRHGAKMISAVSEATVPKISVVVRKAYGAGLYAMAGPAFDPDCCLALPSASIAVMGPQAAINAVYYNQLQAIADEAERAAETERLRAEYAADIDILHLASELVIDAVIEPDQLRAELIARFALAASRRREWPARNNPITPV
jgi:acetyl-CoA carboxylase carboxyltransferase component